MRISTRVIASCLVVASVGCGKKQQPEPTPVPVQVQTVNVADTRPTRIYSGEIRPDTEVDLSFKQGGYVTSLHSVKGADGRSRDIQVGDQVPAGTSLAQLRITDFEASMTQAAGSEDAAKGALEGSKADLNAAIAKQKKADADFQRAEALYAAKAMTRPDYDTAVSNHTAGTANMQAAMQTVTARQGQFESARGQTAAARLALRDASLVVPMPSIVVAKKVERGTLVASGTVGFTVADARTVKVAFGVPDGELAQFHMGAPVRVDVDALRGQTFTGHISEIASSADRDSRVFTVKVTLPNAKHAFKIGMIASVVVETDATLRVPLVPSSSLITSQSGSTNYSVFVVQTLNGKQVARLKSVRIGETIGDSVAINDGLVPGDKIIINLTNGLTDGTVVRVTN